MKKREYVLARNYPRTGDRLQKLRLEAGLTQLEISQVLGYSSAQFISNFERGIATPPAAKLKIMLKAYGLKREAQLEVVELILEEDKEVFLSKLGMATVVGRIRKGAKL